MTTLSTSLTARALIEAAESRGLTLRVNGEQIKGTRGLRKDERTFLADPVNIRAVAALLELDRVLREEEEQNAREYEAELAEAVRHANEERRKDRLAVIATWEPERVVALAAAGKLSPEEIRIWHACRAELKRRANIVTMAHMLSGSTRSVVVRFRG